MSTANGSNNGNGSNSLLSTEDLAALRSQVDELTRLQPEVDAFKVAMEASSSENTLEGTVTLRDLLRTLDETRQNIETNHGLVITLSQQHQQIVQSMRNSNSNGTDTATNTANMDTEMDLTIQNLNEQNDIIRDHLLEQSLEQLNQYGQLVGALRQRMATTTTA